MKKIYHCDPINLYKREFEKVFNKFSEIRIIGNQETYSGLHNNLNFLKPDILITNNYLIDDGEQINMIEKLSDIRNEFPKLKIIMLTIDESIELQNSLKQKNLIDVFLVKSMNVEEIYNAILFTRINY